MKRIGIIVSDISAGAGTERAVINLSNALCKFGQYQPVIISVYTTDKASPYYELCNKIKIIHLGFEFSSSRVARLLLYRRIKTALETICVEEHLDFIMGTTHAYNCVISRLKHVIRIGCEHVSYNACPKIIALIRKIQYPKLNQVVVLTEADKLKYSFLSNDKVCVIPNIRSFENEKRADLFNKVIISVGRLTHQKGYDIMLDLATLLKEMIPEWKICIHGSGEEYDSLITDIKEKQLEKYVYLKEPTKNIKKRMMEAALYLMTSRHEGLPMVLLEAQACGLPIVSFDCPEGPRDIITDGEDGYLINTFDIDEMAKKICRLANDDELRNKMGSCAFYNSNRFSENAIVSKWESLFDEMERSSK